MKSKFMIAAVAAAVATPMVASAPAQAQYYSDGYSNSYQDSRYGHSDYDRNYYNHGYDRYDRTYRGRDVNYYRDCRRSKGTTGLIAGGAGGALLGSALGGGTLGTVLGAVGGGLLGKHLVERHDAAQIYRNGC